MLPIISKQDVQSSQRAELQGSLVLAEEGGKDGNGVRENWPQIDFQRRAGDQRQSCHTHRETGTSVRNTITLLKMYRKSIQTNDG